MKPALEIQNISKLYRIRHELKPYLSIRDSISGLFRRNSSVTEDFYALKDVSFDVMPGDTLGIIGKNGAGKSTLLKIISRITPPSSGKIKCRGRIASLLEVGTGFHPELSGRENIYFNGSILGMKKKEIDKNFDAIVDFAGVEKFIDTPLKHYSSGMQLRLAFAVAAFLENEILIIDEVLAVGDAEFQKKCLGKMDEVSKSGRTVLFVSHDINAVSTLTKNSILLSQGELVKAGNTNEIIHYYLEGTRNQSNYSNPASEIHPNITFIQLKTTHPGNQQECEKPLQVELKLSIPEKLPEKTLWLTIQITDIFGKGIIHVWTNNKIQDFGRTKGIQSIICEFPKLKLYQGHYNLNVYFSGPPNEEIYDRIINVCPFEVFLLNKKREWEYTPDECAYFETAYWITPTQLNH